MLFGTGLKEEDMLKDFLAWWAENTPDILTGWNVKLFDVPYICRRIDRERRDGSGR